MAVKTLKFAPHLVAPILSGEKTGTWRMFDDKDLSVGDELLLVGKADGKKFARARITAVTEKKLGEVAESDYTDHERYKSTEEMLGNFRGYYGDKVTLDTLFKVVRFELLK